MPGVYIPSRTLSTGHGPIKITNCALEPNNSFVNCKDNSEALLNFSVNDFGRDLGIPRDTIFDVKGIQKLNQMRKPDYRKGGDSKDSTRSMIMKPNISKRNVSFTIFLVKSNPVNNLILLCICSVNLKSVCPFSIRICTQIKAGF